MIFRFMARPSGNGFAKGFDLIARWHGRSSAVADRGDIARHMRVRHELIKDGYQRWSVIAAAGCVNTRNRISIYAESVTGFAELLYIFDDFGHEAQRRYDLELLKTLERGLHKIIL